MTPSRAPVRIVDSHTAGEPTRVVIDGGPSLGTGSLEERRQRFKSDYDHFRSFVILEPRGSDVLVGALLTEPTQPKCAAGVIFFNNTGYLGMCGHGTIGLVATLAYLGRIQPGTHLIETPVGIVRTTLQSNGEISVENVPSYRFKSGVSVDLPGGRSVTGDIAWGGNWFFLVENHGLEIAATQVDELTSFCWAIRQTLNRCGVTGAKGAEIDHIELTAPSTTRGVNARNFVLCPGKAYDRSPCGTGTSAKVACLASDGKLAEGEKWVQESVIGSSFVAQYRKQGDQILPTITGRAHITMEGVLIQEEADPFLWGIR